jgi:enoyl-CoA hydratase/carnithine racemase
MSLIEVRDEGDIRWIGLNRPDKRNAIDQATSNAFSAALDDARTRPCVLIVHSVTPGIFAAGADIAELRERDADAALLAINAGLFEKLEAHRWPTIAAVDGPALGGGCELALELTKLALRSHRPATTTFDMAAQALLFGTQDKYDRMTAFLDRRRG